MDRRRDASAAAMDRQRKRGPTLSIIPTQTVERQLAANVTKPTLADFLGVLFDPADLIELRPLRHGSKHHPDQQWLTPAELAELDVSRINADASVYFGANPRPKRGDSKNDHIALCRCVLADFDNGITPEQAAARIELAALPHPSAIVASGGGTHCYWLLDKPTDPETWRATQKGIIEVLGCDNIHDPARVMRLPGTINRKLKRNGAECRLIDFNHDRHALIDFPQVVEPVADAAPESTPRLLPPPTPSNAADRCIKYLEKIPDAISGQDGHGRTLQAACECYRFGLSDADAASVMHWFNQSKCAPAWTEGELQHKLDSAKAKVGKASEIGMRLTEERDTNDLPAGSAWQLQAGIEGPPQSTPPPPQIKPISLGSLIQLHPKMSRPVIDGVLRSGEVGNIIAASKMGKSWLMYALLICIATGRQWLDTFNCTAGRVLLIDNELKPETISNRLPKVAAAMGVSMADINEAIDVLPLRGKSITLDKLASYIAKIEQGQYQAIVLDAWYRFIPKGSSENDNADVMHLYNLLDQYAEQTGAAIVAVHHASKGQQGDKAVTDVGAGAGSQSRAADAHVVLRPHEEDGHVVLEAAVRSFKPLEPTVLRWDFPVWKRVDDMNAEALKDRKTKLEHRREQNDAEGITKIVESLRPGPLTIRKIRDATGISKGRVERLLDRLNANGSVQFEEITIRGQPAREYALVP